ncbi:phage replication initiation protein [Anaerotignum sp.]|uniref:phage replication initiation protein n=1 Tax=Anaerotignum sp. TaxID=2039241 RepID=UPI002714EDD7|nr:phage replication initiation protein [Anaerotignum sp.]
MAQKRMFTIHILDSDAFLDMPLSSQCLYLHLNMRADDDGFIGNPKRIQRMIGASDDDLKLLIAKRFVLVFDDGVIVIKHWRMHNTIQGDRYTPTVYQEEMNKLLIKGNKSYSLNDGNKMFPKCKQNDNTGLGLGLGLDLDKGLGLGLEEGKGEDEEPKEKKTSFSPSIYIKEQCFSYSLGEKMLEWVAYKKENRKSYKETGLRNLCTQVKNQVLKYGENAVINLITECMGNGWQGIAWDKLEKRGDSSGKHRTDNAERSERVEETEGERLNRIALERAGNKPGGLQDIECDF